MGVKEAWAGGKALLEGIPDVWKHVGGRVARGAGIGALGGATLGGVTGMWSDNHTVLQGIGYGALGGTLAGGIAGGALAGGGIAANKWMPEGAMAKALALSAQHPNITMGARIGAAAIPGAFAGLGFASNRLQSNEPYNRIKRK